MATRRFKGSDWATAPIVGGDGPQLVETLSADWLGDREVRGLLLTGFAARHQDASVSEEMRERFPTPVEEDQGAKLRYHSQIFRMLCKVCAIAVEQWTIAVVVIAASSMMPASVVKPILRISAALPISRVKFKACSVVARWFLNESRR